MNSIKSEGRDSRQFREKRLPMRQRNAHGVSWMGLVSVFVLVRKSLDRAIKKTLDGSTFENQSQAIKNLSMA